MCAGRTPREVGLALCWRGAASAGLLRGSDIAAECQRMGRQGCGDEVLWENGDKCFEVQKHDQCE